MPEELVPPDEQRRRSAASLFLKVYDLDPVAAAAQRPVAHLCHLMLSESLRTGCDGLRVLAPEEQRARVQMHRDGTWVDVMALPAQAQVPVINRLKVMANLDIARRPVQEGTLKVRLRGEERSLAITVRLRGDFEEASLELSPS